MKVRLVSMTCPVSGHPDKTVFQGEISTIENLIVYCARVSNPENQHNIETGAKLLRYLIQHKHWSPFEMASFTVEIRTSRAIAAQILRHKSFSFQEFSQRYSPITQIEDVEVRRQAEKNRQSSTEVFDPILKDGSSASKLISEQMKASMNLYTELLEAGVAKESARMILPLATETTLYMSGTVRSWIHYLQLRCEEDTQLEHREVANEVRSIFIDILPNVASALDWTNTHGKEKTNTENETNTDD